MIKVPIYRRLSFIADASVNEERILFSIIIFLFSKKGSKSDDSVCVYVCTGDTFCTPGNNFWYLKSGME